MKIIGVIPARLGSTRLQEKVLKPINGRPMIQHVWERARQAKRLDELIIACDDERIIACAKQFGAVAQLTRQDHPNGSSRVGEIATKNNADVLINIQGDEPMIHPHGIDQLAEVFCNDTQVEVATLAVRRSMDDDYNNPNVVKVVCDAKGDSLYFSRSPLPYFRDPQGEQPRTYLKHLGIYGYRKDFLLKFITWPVSQLEQIEKLEQLRILEKGYRLRVVETAFDSYSVDTADDLNFVEKMIQKESVRIS